MYLAAYIVTGFLLVGAYAWAFLGGAAAATSARPSASPSRCFA